LVGHDVLENLVMGGPMKPMRSGVAVGPNFSGRSPTAKRWPTKKR
jgi:hypothetical protein